MTLFDLLLPYQKTFVENSKQFKLWLASRQIGKSFSVAFIAAHEALKKAGNLVLVISVNARAAAELLNKCKQMAEAVKELSNGTIDYSASFECVKFSNGSRIMSLPSGNPESLRSWTAVCTIIDEAAFIEHLEDVMQAIGPALTRNPEAQMIFTTTPAGMNGTFYDIYQKALADERFYVQTTTIHDAISDGLEVNLDNLHTICPDPDVFAQEYECKFQSSYGCMLDTQLLEFYDDEISKFDGVYFSADIGRSHDRSAVVITKLVKDIIYVDDILMLNKVEYQKQLDIFRNLNNKWHFNGGLVDATGIGNAVAEFANKQISVKIKPFMFTATSKTLIYEGIRDKVFQHKIKFSSKFKQLIVQDFKNVQRIVTESGAVKFQAGSNDEGHSDFVSSLAMNIQAIKDNPVSMAMPQAFNFNSVFGGYHPRL